MSRQEITVLVGGAPYPAEIDEHGTLRFKRNWAVVVVHESGPRADMNQLAIIFQTSGTGLSLREYAEYHMLIGYSVDGFCDLSSFEHLEVIVPEYKAGYGWRRIGKRPWKCPQHRHPKSNEP